MSKHDVESIKTGSNHLRGTLLDSLADAATGALADDDTQLSKFHGIYQQDDRDTRDERRKRFLAPDHSFMIRARVPGGVCTPEQWLAMDAIATTLANDSLRLTTRQAFQFHGVLKGDLKPSLQAIDRVLMDTLAACGDVNRNVMCTPLPELSAVHRDTVAAADGLSEHLTPATTAYHEIWMDREKVSGGPDEEPIYGKTYLPRKFKVAFAIPPQNDVDVQAHDLGFVAIEENGALAGFNVTVGGGMGATHGDPATYPLLAQVLGFCTPEQVNAVGETIVTIQRDFGDRGNRKHARFKYTVEDHGLEWLREEFERRAGFALAPPRTYHFTDNGDRYGWQQGDDGLWHLLLYIQNGRIRDTEHAKQLTGLREIAHLGVGEFRLTPNQNVALAKIPEAEKDTVDALTREHGLDAHEQLSALRLNAMACVALPTCSLAMAEAERYLPDLLGRFEALLERHGLGGEAITVRMTGCPNGCARPYLAEIGLVGKAPGRYNLHLGAAFDGTRLNRRVGENMDERQILSTLDEWLGRYASQREAGERFGDFVTRQLTNETPEAAHA